MAVPVHNRWLFLFTAALLLIGAAFLRWHQIDRRTFHADEAVQAYQTWRLLRGEGYTYDPADKHGPFLYYATAGLAKITGRAPATVSETWFRSVTLLAGLGTLALILGAAARLGRVPVLIGAALLAVAPLAVIYDTYFIQEAWFCLFTWALFFAVLRWWGTPNLAGSLLIGVLVGLMQATKETSIIHFVALGVALVVHRWSALTPTRLRQAGPEPAHWGQCAPPAEARFCFKNLVKLWPSVMAAVFIYVLFYSSFFTHWSGVVDGVRTYFNYAARAADSAHNQPWYYYFGMLWPHVREGVSWGEPLLVVMALFGVNFAFSSRANAAQRALAVFTLTLLLLYSFIPYKTPWLLLTPYVGLTLLAGLGAAHGTGWWPAKLVRFAPAFLCVALLLEGGWRDLSALDRYANDDRNPYLYQPTAPDLSRLVAIIAAFPANWKVAVISPDHAWPLPWYLRDRRAAGYFTTAPAVISDYDLVLYDSRLDNPAPIAATIYGLRPNVFLWHTTQ